jgi:hypothetical protein
MGISVMRHPQDIWGNRDAFRSRSYRGGCRRARGRDHLWLFGVPVSPDAAIERTAGQRDLLGQCRSWVHLTIQNEGLTEILRKVLADWDSGTPEEREKGSAWMLSAALQAEQALYMRKERLINETSYRGFIAVAVSLAATPGGRLWWTQARVALGDDISDLIDQELESRDEEALDWTQIFTHLGPDDLPHEQG